MSNSSNIAKYVTKHKHSFSFNQAETLSHENNWKCRIIKESRHAQKTLGQST